MNAKLRTIKVISRTALGLVWFYEGLVPKILFLRADELDLVKRSGFVWPTPERTLQVLGIAQIVADHWICGTHRRVDRNIMDVDPDRAGCVRKSVDADRSLRRPGEGFLLDRVRDYSVDPRATLA